MTRILLPKHLIFGHTESGDKTISLLHMSFISICNIYPVSFINVSHTLTKSKYLFHPQVLAFVLQDECFAKNYLSFLDFTCNYERTSGIFVRLVLRKPEFVACDQQWIFFSHVTGNCSIPKCIFLDILTCSPVKLLEK